MSDNVATPILKVSPETNRCLEHLYPFPEWATGNVSVADAKFLHEMVLRISPSLVVELGVASGTSTSVILHALNRVQGELRDRLYVYSFDPLRQCYFDASRRVGSAVFEMAPELRSSVLFALGQTGADLRKYFDEPVLQLAFIDADHRHPHPCNDLLWLLPVLAPRAWVALHDIRLARITDVKEWKTHGPEYLFDGWPYERIIADPDDGPQNIGAIRMPDEPPSCIGLVEEIRAKHTDE